MDFLVYVCTVDFVCVAFSNTLVMRFLGCNDMLVYVKIRPLIEPSIQTVVHVALVVSFWYVKQTASSGADTADCEL